MSANIAVLGIVSFVTILGVWLYAILYPRTPIEIKTNGTIIQRRKKWISLVPRDIINVRPDKGLGENNIQFCVPPNIGKVTFHIRCEIFKEDEYILKSGNNSFYGHPV